MNVTIIGTGYVGLTTGVCLAYLGHNVTCIDTDESKVASLNAGVPTIYEPFLEDLMAEARPNLRFTTSYEEGVPGAEVVFIAVGTPSLANGSPDLRYVRAAAAAIGQYFDGEHLLVVNKSTVPIGSGNWVLSLLTEAQERLGMTVPKGRFSVASNPEFLREGTAIADSLYPDRVVIGCDNERSMQLLYTLYRPVLDQTFPAPSFLPRPDGLGAAPLVSTDVASSELVKYAANAFLALKISYINEIGVLAEKVGADVSSVGRGIGLDTRIGSKFLHAGLGWGGSCFGKDTAGLLATAGEYGIDMPIVRAAREMNRRQRERVVEKLTGELRILKGRTIGILGLAFKPNTDDLRDAPAIDIAEKLIARGCKVRVHDPIALDRFRREQPDLDVTCCERAEQVAQHADALVLVTEWQQYRELDWAGIVADMRTPVILDGRNVLDRGRLTQYGARCLGMASDSGAMPLRHAASGD